MRLIDADALKKDVNGISTHWLNDWSTIGVLSIIDKQPTVEPDMAQVLAYECGKAERKRGKWVEEPNCTYRCSQCGEHYQSIRGYMYHNFCPNCGADMRGEANDAICSK